MGDLIFRDILFIFLAAVPVILVLNRFRLPPVTGFILTGALIGPSGLGLIQDSPRIETLAQIGVTLLLFSIGLEFSVASIAKLKTYVLKGGLLQILGCVVFGTAAGLILRWPTTQGLYFGCMIALSSTAVVLTSLMNERYHHSLQGRIATGILILQDLAVIPMLVFLPSLGRETHAYDLWREFAWDLGRVLILFGLTYFFIRYLADKLFRAVSRTQSRELFLGTVICFALGMAWLTSQMGLSFALGAFLAGMTVGSTDYQSEALSEISPFRLSFNSLFFVSIGMLIDFEFVRLHWTTVLLLVALIPLVKTAIMALVMILLKAPLRVALNVGIILGQVGEFSFLLATLGKNAGAIDFGVYQHLIAAAAVTMLGTPLMVKISIPFSEFLARLPVLKNRAFSPSESAVQEEVRSHADHVIICGFGPLGEALGHLLDKYRIPYVILELNPETVERTREKEKNIFFGDGASEEILYRSGIEKAKMLAITVPDYFNNVTTIRQARRLNPEITIIARAKYKGEVESLYDAGADVVVSEELEGGIEMGRYALLKMGVASGEVNAYIDKIREFGSADFF